MLYDILVLYLNGILLRGELDNNTYQIPFPNSGFDIPLLIRVVFMALTLRHSSQRLEPGRRFRTALIRLQV
jgi:hypothetical protein